MAGYSVVVDEKQGEMAAGTDAAEFGTLLRRLRREAELTQEQLAERAGLSVRSIGDLERGVSKAPYRATVQDLADALDLAEHEKRALMATSRRGKVEPARSPFPVTPLPDETIGRQEEISEVTTLLTNSESGLVTLNGPGGVGKTRLALEVAAALQNDRALDVRLIALAPLRDPALLAGHMIHTLMPAEKEAGTATRRLIAYLRDRPVVLLLDNFEHLLSATSLVAELLSACPLVKMLVTSRAALGLRGEKEYRVQPLRTPMPEDELPAEALLSYPSVQLFLRHAMAVRPDFVLTHENAVAVAAICRKLDGLPLAIELAAARTKILPPRTLLEQLEKASGIGTMRLLSGTDNSRPDRLRTMRNALNWTYDSLSAERKTLFRRLSVFTSGATLEAIDDICDPDDVLEDVSDLVNQSLLRPEEQADGQVRFSMLEVIREYAFELLEESGEAGSIKGRWARYYRDVARRYATDLLAAGDQEDRLHRLDHEYGNLRACLGWLSRSALDDDLLEMAISLCDYWEVRGYQAEGLRWLEKSFSATRVDTPALRAESLRSVAVLTSRLGDYERSIRAMREAIEIFRTIGDEEKLARMLLLLGATLQDRGEYEQSADLKAQALDIFRERGDKAKYAQTLNDLGTVKADLGEIDEARQLYRESLALCREVGDIRASGIALCNLSDLAIAAGDYDGAIELSNQSIEAHRTLGDEGEIARSLTNLGAATWRKGEHERAAPILIEALTTAHRLGHKPVLALYLSIVAAFVADTGRAETAARLWGASEALHESMGAALQPDLLARYQTYLLRPKSMLGEDEWERLCGLGRTMPIDRVVEWVTEEYARTTPGRATRDVVR
ncbi:MAG: ATP-binding protein [Chloroflexota bacterium]